MYDDLENAKTNIKHSNRSAPFGVRTYIRDAK